MNEWIKNLNEWGIQILNWLNNIYVLGIIIGIVIVLFIIIGVSVNFTNNINDYSNKKIAKFVSEKKYISNLFVELNDTKEELRYFIYGNKWRKRIIQDYNYLFSDFYGELLQEAFLNECVSLHLSVNTHIEELIQEIDNTRDFLNKLYNDEVEIPDQYEESIKGFYFLKNPYDEKLLKLRKRAECAKSQYVILIGNAGNGKTNLLCSITELLIKLKYPCVFINARDVNSSISEYFVEQLCIPNILRNKEWAMTLFAVLLRFRKSLFVVIDAVNENNKDEFLNGLSGFIKNLLRHKNVKILVSCRSEYYKSKYKGLLQDDISYESYCDNIQEVSYTQNALDRIFKIYSEEYKFKGTIGTVAKKELCSQLLLLKIFFEAYAYSNDIINDLDHNELFEKYIEIIAEQKQVEVENLLLKVAGVMIARDKFDFIYEQDLSEDNLDVFNAIYGSILLGETITNNEGNLLEKHTKVIYFVFDEMRDYHIARYALFQIKGSYNHASETEKIKQCIDMFVDENAVCKEGVINYYYRDCKKSKDEITCSMILNNYIKPIDWGYQGQTYWLEDGFKEWGLQLIFDYSGELMQCEKEYILYFVNNQHIEFIPPLFKFLITQELDKGVYNFNIFIDILGSVSDVSIIIEILKVCADPWTLHGMDQTNYINIDKKLADISKDAVFRFRKYEVLFCAFFDWTGKKELLDYLNDNCDLESIQDSLRNQYTILADLVL